MKGGLGWSIGIILVVMVLALLFLIPKETGTVKVGVLTPISGPAAFYGESIVNGIDCAKQLVNENGGINGRRIELVVEDSKCDGATAVTAAQKLINVDGVSGIVGEACSAAVISMGSIAENSKVVVIASAASNPKVTENPYLFRVNPNDLAQSEAIAGYIKENFGLKKVGILAQNDEYGIGLVDEFKKRYIALGGEIKATELFTPDAKDFRTQLTKLGSSNFDVLFITALPAQHPEIAKQINELGKNWTKIADFNFGTVPEDSKNSAMKGTIYPTSIFYETVNSNAKFLSECIRAKGKTADVLAAWGFDALYVFANSAEKCTKVTGECVKENLIGLSFDGAYGQNRITDKQEIEKINSIFLID